MLTVGDIGVTDAWVVTPNGTGPLAGSQWIVLDQTRTEKKIPTWAIVLAVVLFLACFLGLLFLLVKEETTTGYVEVSVRTETVYHTTQVPVASPQQVQQVRARVHQAQSLAARASG